MIPKSSSPIASDTPACSHALDVTSSGLVEKLSWINVVYAKKTNILAPETDSSQHNRGSDNAIRIHKPD